MSLESLANELLFDVFEYFSTAQLLQSFYGHNHRFNMLVFDHICVRGLDLRAVIKRDIDTDTVCQQYLSLIIHRIKMLYFSNDENSLECQPFITPNVTLRQFTHLRKLTLFNLASVTMVNNMISDCCHLLHLTDLRLDNCHFPCSQIDVVNIVNMIWSLPKLVNCYLDIDSPDNIEFSVPKVTSSLLVYLSIPNMVCRLSELADLILCTPCLQSLSACFTYDSDGRNYPSAVSSIVNFDTWLVAAEQYEIVNILVHMPNLCSLTVQTINDISVDGRQWEQIISSHLTQLKRFRLKLSRKLVSDQGWQQHFDELIDSFRSRFWIEERHWYVQCDWDPDIVAIYLYTLPYAFDRFTVHVPLVSKSTCPTHLQYSYGHVRRLKYICSPSEDLNQCHISFANVQDLTVYLPINQHLWMVVPKFHQLTSLCVAWYDYKEEFVSQIQLLLDCAPRLYSLSIEKWRSPPTQMAPFEITNTSIRRLDFYNYHYHYTNEECAILARSPLGIQCEKLRIAVNNRTCVLDLVNAMTNLRQLIVQCKDDKYIEQSMIGLDELVEWLQQHLPSICTISRSIRLGHEVNLLIRNVS